MDFLTDPFLLPAERFDGPVMVTGAAGCIGAWAVAILTRSGVPCIAADMSSDRTRPGLVMGDAAAQELTWVSCDVTDGEQVSNLVEAHGVRAIIHLAGLQVPFCAANPAMGARVNVEGTINIFEAARAADMKRLVYATSVASLAFPPGGPFKETLYGAYKMANEHCAHVYWADWKVPSVGIRPNVVYGIGRDQGMSSVNTVGIQAAALGQAFDIPFSGLYSWLYAGEAAAAFIAAVSQPGEGSPVFNLNGRSETLESGLGILQELQAGAAITTSGDPFPFPPDLDDTPIRSHVADYPSITVREGVETTFRAFQKLAADGRLTDLPG